MSIHWNPRMAVVACFISLSLAHSLAKASAPAQTDNPAQEYIQVRKIALRDPKVRAAFEKANERLDQKIIEIDPSLKSYVERKKSGGSTPDPVLPSATPRPVVATREHVVGKGETLSSIARRYKTSVEKLKNANGINDERKLKIGQKLIIPSPSTEQVSPAEGQATWGKIKPAL